MIIVFYSLTNNNNIIFETTISVKLLNIKPNLTASVYFTCICVMNYYALLPINSLTMIIEAALNPLNKDNRMTYDRNFISNEM